MKSVFKISFFLLFVSMLSCSANAGDRKAELGIQTNDSAISPEEAVFEIMEIDDALFSRIKGKSYKDDCAVPLSSLRYLLVAHYDGDGNVRQGELICNAEIAEDLLDIFSNLYVARYSIGSMRLVDDFDADDIKSMQANNTSCFNFRTVAGTAKLSKHSRGLAIDINPLYNPYVKGATVSPAEGAPYADRRADFPYRIDESDLCYQEFAKHGFKWGGHWKTMKDYQHFEK